MESPQKRLNSHRSAKNRNATDSTKVTIVHTRKQTQKSKVANTMGGMSASFITQTSCKEVVTGEAVKKDSDTMECDPIATVEMVDGVPLQPPSLEPEVIFSPPYNDSGSEIEDSSDIREMSPQDLYLAQMELES
jgi:hypothetical protein